MNYEAIIAQKDQEIAYLKQEIAELKRLIFGIKSERFKPIEQPSNQLSLFGMPQDDKAQHEAVQTISYERKKPTKKHEGRNEIPEHFPVEEIVIEPQEDTTEMVKVGEQITEYVEYTPAELKKIRIVRPKYAPKSKEGSFVIGLLPNRALPKSIASESLLTWLFVRKFVEHMPFYRQRQAILRDNQWDIPASTINDWFVAVCSLLEPLYNKLKEKVLNSGYLQVDESPIKVQDSDKKGSTHQGYQWVYHSPEQKLLFFDYRRGRGKNGPKEILEDYTGLLQSDGYGVYDKIGKKRGINLAGCLVHVRRYYDKAKDSDPARSAKALNIFHQIYKIEGSLKSLAPQDRKIQRDRSILPILTELKTWVDQECILITPKSQIGQAMTYTQKQWTKILTILQDGRYELDNNLIENKIRPLALGRKNYLFAGSHDGAQRIAMMYSFFGSCAANDINPYMWLKYTLENINDTKMSKLDSLLPGN